MIPNEMLWRHLSLVSLMRKTLRSRSAGGRETDRAQSGVGRDVGQKQKDSSLGLLLQSLSNCSPPHCFTHTTKCKPGAFSAIS